MTDALMASVFTGGITLAVCLINNYANSRRLEQQHKTQHDETMSIINYKLDELTKRVDKHNNLVERTYKLEKAISIQEEKIKVADHRIQDLEQESLDS